MTPPTGAFRALTACAPWVCALSLALLLGGCEEPFVVLPGEALQGSVMDPPADWSAFADLDIAQLETNPADPYSVNLWVAAIGSDIYVATGEDGTNWTKHIELNRDVRLRLKADVYELEARRVNDPEEVARVAAEYVRKYDLDAEDNWVLEGQVFRLDRR